MEWADEDKEDPNRRCVTWENQILIKARNPEEAYHKAIEQGKLHEDSEFWEEGNKNRKGKFIFEGLTTLLAIYDKFEHGSEITWSERRNRKVKTIKKRVKTKDELEVFEQT